MNKILIENVTKGVIITLNSNGDGVFDNKQISNNYWSFDIKDKIKYTNTKRTKVKVVAISNMGFTTLESYIIFKNNYLVFTERVIKKEGVRIFECFKFKDKSNNILEDTEEYKYKIDNIEDNLDSLNAI